MIQALPPRRPASTASSRPSSLSLDLDTDGDGIPDSWMFSTSGILLGWPATGRGHRTMRTAMACRIGRSIWPGLVRSIRRAASNCIPRCGPGTGRPQIGFTAMPGIGYTLQYSDNVTPGIWQKLTDVPADRDIRIITLNDVGAASAPIRLSPSGHTDPALIVVWQSLSKNNCRERPDSADSASI